MLDGIDLKGRTNIVALGITTDGVKIPLGLWEGSTENATVATALLVSAADTPPAQQPPEFGNYMFFDESPDGERSVIGSWSSRFHQRATQPAIGPWVG